MMEPVAVAVAAVEELVVTGYTAGPIHSQYTKQVKIEYSSLSYS